MEAFLNMLCNSGGRRPRILGPASRFHNLLAGNRSRIARGNSVEATGAFLRGVSIVIAGTGSLLRIGPRCRLYGTSIEIRGSGSSVIFGEETVIHGGSFLIEDSSCRFDMGKDCFIKGAHVAVTEPGSSVTIGDDCIVGNADIRCGDSHSMLDIKTGRRINYARDIRIGNHVWINHETNILKGVTIGNDSVVGVRSVVTRDVPPNTVVAGIPARVVREGITWDRRRLYDRPSDAASALSAPLREISEELHLTETPRPQRT